MQTKGEYTPGPWSVHTEDDASISRARSVYICTEQGWPEGQLARVNVQDGLGEREANASLIAAAPELLSIAKRFVALPSGAWHPERHAAEEAELMRDARAAIAKATMDQGGEG